MSSSTTKSGRLLYCSETVILGKIFPKLMVMGHFAPRNNPARPNSTPNSLRLSSVKGKKSVARNRITIGDQSSVVGVLNSNCAGLNQPQVSANLVGKDGQRRCCDGQYRSGGVDVMRFTAGTISSRGESGELGFCPGQGASTADPTLGVCQLSNQGNMEGELNVGFIFINKVKASQSMHLIFITKVKEPYIY